MTDKLSSVPFYSLLSADGIANTSGLSSVTLSLALFSFFSVEVTFSTDFKGDATA